jgi:hypothetical protein
MAKGLEDPDESSLFAKPDVDERSLSAVFY